MVNKVFIGDVGTDIVLRTGADLTLATAVTFYFKKPDGSVINRTGYIVSGEETGGEIHYTTQADDFDISGEYKIQARVDFNTNHFYTDIVELYVYEAIV